ncbi:MAG: hypothetical protein KAS04_02285 [Candidatus Aenigmarchaeota archaeon]|nr:hypothetical protein [Candidatus Aenigmarchaeota archaeon]
MYECEPIDSLLVEQEELRDKARFFEMADHPQYGREKKAREENKRKLRLVAEAIRKLQESKNLET